MYQREMVLYTRGPSLRCWRAGRFLQRAGYGFEVVDVGGDHGMLERLSAAAHREVARQCVRESLVLLKNDGGLLPLSPKQRRSM